MNLKWGVWFTKVPFKPLNNQFKNVKSSIHWSLKEVKGTVVNQTSHLKNGGSFENTCTVPFLWLFCFRRWGFEVLYYMWQSVHPFLRSQLTRENSSKGKNIVSCSETLLFYLLTKQHFFKWLELVDTEW